MSSDDTPFIRIGEIFYRTRALRGREWTLKRFATELGVDPVFLGYIEKGQRFPNEELVTKLAKIRDEDPKELLSILFRDRMVHVLAREIRRAVVGAEQADADENGGAGEDVSLTPVLSRALVALPDSGDAIPEKRWLTQVRAALREHRGKARREELDRVIELLEAKKLVAREDGRVRKLARHLQATDPSERVELAIEFASIFAKSLTDKIVRQRSSTYLKNHFLSIPKDRVAALSRRVDAAIREVVMEYADDDGADDFVRVLVAGTPKE